MKPTPATSKEKKQQLLEIVRELISAHDISKQEDLCANLKQRGFEVNQTKISRVLRKLGAVKVINANEQIVYKLPKESVPCSVHSPIKKLIRSVKTNGFLIVIHTSPGAATIISRLLDYNENHTGILGSVCGDNTIFVTPKEIEKIDEVLACIKELLLH